MASPRPSTDIVAALILAAGASTRFGSPKQKAKVGERTMLEAVVETARAADCGPILAVVPPRLPVPPQAVPVLNAEPQRGLSHSLRLGIAAVPPEVGAAVILLGDQPTLDPAVVRRVIAARGERPIVACLADGLAGPPVLIERSHFDVVASADGDSGLRDLIRGSPDVVSLVEVGAHAPDVDTPADLESLLD